MVHDHRPATRVVSSPTIGGKHSCLNGVTRIVLLDRNHVKQAPSTRFVTPYARDTSQSGFLDLVPDHRRLDR